MKPSGKAKLKASEFDRAFEQGDVSEHLELKTLKVRHAVQRINVDMPLEILEKVILIEKVKPSERIPRNL